ncbi:MAG: hypothetical protein RL131_219, partial [Bacteroidota bacterium]
QTLATLAGHRFEAEHEVAPAIPVVQK